MVDVTRIKNSFPVLAIAVTAWTLAGLPAAHAADAPDAKKPAVDLRQQEKDLRNALSANPNDADAHLKLGQIYITEARFAAAVDQARAAQNNSIRRDEADALLAWALYLSNEADRLLSQVKPGQREPHAESTVRLSLGLAHLNPLELDEAGPLLRDAVRLDPKSWRAHLGLAHFLLLKRQVPEARQEVDAARSIAPDEIGVLRLGAEVDRASGDTDAAIAKFSKVIELHVNLPALAGRADALLSENKLPEAMRDITTALKLNSHSQVVFLAGLVLAQQGKWNEADQLLAKAAQHFASLRIGYYLTGVVKLQLGDAEIADYNLKKFNGQEPNVSGAARLLAEIALKRRDPRSAIKVLQPVVDANPADQEVITALARAHLVDGHPEQVIELYQKVTAALPAKGAPEADMASMQMIYGDATGDLAEIEKLVAKKAPDAIMPMIPLRQGDVATASSMAEALVAKDPNDPVAQNYLGSVRLAQKRFPEAETIFRGILNKHPDFNSAGLNLIEVLVAENRPDEAKFRLQQLAQSSSNG